MRPMHSSDSVYLSTFPNLPCNLSGYYTVCVVHNNENFVVLKYLQYASRPSSEDDRKRFLHNFQPEPLLFGSQCVLLWSIVRFSSPSRISIITLYSLKLGSAEMKYSLKS